MSGKCNHVEEGEREREREREGEREVERRGWVEVWRTVTSCHSIANQSMSDGTCKHPWRVMSSDDQSKNKE